MRSENTFGDLIIAGPQRARNKNLEPQKLCSKPDRSRQSHLQPNITTIGMHNNSRLADGIAVFVALGCAFFLQNYLVSSMAITSCQNPSSMHTGTTTPVPLVDDEKQKYKGSSTKMNGHPSVIFPVVARDLASWTPKIKLFSNIRAKLAPENKKYVATWGKQKDFAPVANSIACSIHSCFDDDKEAHRARIADIEDSMKTFMSFCEANLDAGRILGYEIKVSHLQGETATQCPAYHVDNVPVRWIETLHGPGRVYLDPDDHASQYGTGGLLRNMADNTPPEKFRKYPGLRWKEEIVKSLGIKPSQAGPGQPVLLVGRRWADGAKEKHRSREGVLHRSPSNVSNSQARILLVLDVKMEGCNECNCGIVHSS